VSKPFSGNSESGGRAQGDLIGGCEIVSFPGSTDSRGALVWGQEGMNVPFRIRRFFVVYGAPQGQSRGSHAHLLCHQLLIAASGKILVDIDDGSTEQRVALNEPGHGLYLPPLVWGTQYFTMDSSALVVLASHPFDEKDYVSDYETFRAIRSESLNLQVSD